MLMATEPVGAAASFARMTNDQPLVDLEAQLRSLYADRALLFAEFGTADARTLIALIRSMEEQLASLYGEREAQRWAGAGDEARTHHAPRTRE
jgi:hypothetical protein